MLVDANSFRPVRMALESRLMLDAALVPAALAGAGSADDSADSTPTSTAPSPPLAHTEVVFAFSDVADWQDIAAAAPTSARVEVIDAGEDGIARMADLLSSMSNIDSIHVIGHGDSGALTLGATVLQAGTVAAHADDLRRIGEALSASGDMLFYGCESGAGGSGLALAQALADATGADVALSSDATGSAKLGGDWTLETSAGQIETAALAAESWNGLLAQTTTTIDVDSSSTAADGAAGAAALSSDGRYVAFTSSATNLVANDTNGASDVFLRDTQTGTTTRVSVTNAGAQANGASTLSDISDNGRYVVFTSTATNLVVNDTNGVQDVFVRDTQSGTTVRVSLTGAGAQANGASSGGSITTDGSRVVFTSSATNLIGPNDTNGLDDVFLRQVTGAPGTTRMSEAAGGVNANGASSSGVISADGTVVAFVSAATNLVAGDVDGVSDVFARTIATNTNQLIANGSAPSISTSGSIVAFASTAALVGADTNGVSDVYRYDRNTATTTLISTNSSGTVGNAASSGASISGAGDYIAFVSSATNLVSSDTNGVDDIFVRDVTNAATMRVSVANSSGAQADATSDNAAISSDGGQVAFRSQATNLNGVDGNAASDIFRASGFTVTPTDLGVGRNTTHLPPPPPPPPVMGSTSDLAQTATWQPGLPPPPPGGPQGGLTAGALGNSSFLTGSGLASGAMGGSGFALSMSPAERMAMFGREGLSLGDRRGLLFGLHNRSIIDGLRDRGDPAARAMAALLARVENGETVTVSEAKTVLASEGASAETAASLLQALAQVNKTVRSEKLAGALKELSVNAAAADAFSKVEALPVRDIELTGNKVALLIGNQTYGNALPSLASPAADVAAVSKVLSDRFGYQAIVANDANKAQIVEMIRSVGERLGNDGSLIIYYAGHGYAVESTGEGYWLPAGARSDSAAGWISTRDLSSYLGHIKANQIMVVSDSCYSGALTKQMRLTSDAVGEPREQLLQRRSVTALSSGGEEPVTDAGANGHSVFANKLLDVLDSADANTMGFQLFSQVRSEVIQSVPQVPTYGGLEAAGHAGRTDFVIGGR
ncbi:MAG: DUF4347 domain-containing protein [Alphaproteobacteria bacterium]|nr:DUF4347 domain-containing protein [Alphaproteobacteria bacterium]